MAPVDRPGTMNVEIDCVGEPFSPTSVAVTGPFAPMIVAVYESSVLPVLWTIKRNVAVPGLDSVWEAGLKLAVMPWVAGILRSADVAP